VSLSDLVAVSEIINAVAVVVTLVVVIVSIRQNTKAQRAVAVDSLAAAIAAINVPLIEAPAVGLAISRAMADWQSASPSDRVTAHYFLFSLFKLHENAWYQQKEGTLDEEQWRGWQMLLRKYYHSKGVREVWWPARRHGYSRAFQEFLAATSDAPEIGSLGDLFGGKGS